MSEELFRKYRPRLLKNVIGQEEATKLITTWVKKSRVPHAILLTGPTGSGKTTIARILQSKIGCGDEDFNEVNAADYTGIDMIRSIQQRMSLAPISGNSRLWVIDEVHKLTNAAQSCFLKPLEEPPAHVYFILVTTDPQKLIPTLRGRCTPISLKSLADESLEVIIKRAAEHEQITLSESVLSRIVSVASGSARQALVALNKIRDLEDEEEQLNAVASCDTERRAIDLARALHDLKGNWNAVRDVLKTLEDDPETVRRIVLGYSSSILLRGGGPVANRACLVYRAFRDNFYDSGKAGLVYACYEVFLK